MVKRTWVGPCARPEEDLDGALDQHHSPSRAVYYALTARGRARSIPARRVAASGVVHAPRRAAGLQIDCADPRPAGSSGRRPSERPRESPRPKHGGGGWSANGRVCEAGARRLRGERGGQLKSALP